MTNTNNKQPIEIEKAKSLNISITEFRELVGDTMFSVTFIKRTNGKVRTMNARLGVKKGVKGVGLAFHPQEKNLLVCYDVQKLEEGKGEKGAFRMINFDNILEIKARGITYTGLKTNE